jgi:opacity protein-like surface antigen
MLTRSYLSNLLILLFVSQIFITTGFSQSTSYLDSLDGKFALQFQITENFSLSNFQGTVFSGKYNFSNRDAIRLGISVSFNDSESEVTNTRPDTNLVNTSSHNVNRINIVLNAQYLYTLTTLSDIGFFIGLGPFLKYENNKIEQNVNTNQSIDSRTETTKYYGLGLDLICGVEWMFIKNMSLSAEYGLRFIYLSGEVVDDREV